MAELRVDVEEAGDWFGGGHLMKQHWPLNLVGRCRLTLSNPS